MKAWKTAWLAALSVLALVPAIPCVRSEVIEEIVAWVDGDIITLSDFQKEEQVQVAEAYRQFTGEELDRAVEKTRRAVLSEMIDRKILLHYAQTRFVVDKMKDAFYEMFKEQQGVESDEELERLLAQEGLTVDQFKDRLVEMLAPDEVVRAEVSSRISVGDREIEEYYAEHPEDFSVPAEVTLREILLLAEDAETKRARRAEAQTVRDRAVAAEDFGLLAQEVSEAGTREDGGLLGPLKRGDLSEQLDDVAFGLGEGEVSEILETPYGFHILKIEQRRDEGLLALEEVRDRLRRVLEERTYFRELRDFLDKARARANWCVKPAYADRLPAELSKQVCESRL